MQKEEWRGRPTKCYFLLTLLSILTRGGKWTKWAQAFKDLEFVLHDAFNNCSLRLKENVCSFKKPGTTEP